MKEELLLVVRRSILSPRSTIGELLVGSEHVCFTLEPPVKPAGALKPYAIPSGTYDVTVRWSPRFDRLMPHVENVPGFEGILIHTGNKPEDTEGCLLVGKQRGPQPDWLGASHIAFDPLFERIREAKEWGDVCITYVDAPPDHPGNAPLAT